MRYQDLMKISEMCTCSLSRRRETSAAESGLETGWADTGLQCHSSKKMLSCFSESDAQTKPVWGACSKGPRRNGMVLPYLVSRCEDLTVRYKTQNHSASGVVGGESLVFLVNMNLAPV